jgi:hypothetical protein
MKRLLALTAGSSIVALLSTGMISLAQSEAPVPVVQASFNSDASINLPVGYRSWVHVGTRYKPVGINILDGLPTKTPEVLNAYVEPGALAAFERTGTWPDGAQIVKEFSAVRIGEGCDAKTALCSTSLGIGIFEAGYVGLGMMVKNVKRFPESAGHWGYFSFGHKPPPYDSTATLRPKQQCESCHINLASDSDYVISRAHIGLARQDDGR